MIKLSSDYQFFQRWGLCPVMGSHIGWKKISLSLGGHPVIGVSHNLNCSQRVGRFLREDLMDPCDTVGATRRDMHIELCAMRVILFM